MKYAWVLLLALAGCKRSHDAPPAATADAGAEAPEGVRLTTPSKLSPHRLLTWLEGASPDATMFVVGTRRERARGVTDGLEALRRVFHAQGAAAPDPDRLADYAAQLGEERLVSATLRAQAERAGLVADEREVHRLASDMRAQISSQKGSLPSDAELEDRATETILVAHLVDAALAPSEAEQTAWLTAHRAELTFADAAHVYEVLVPRPADPAGLPAARARAAELRAELASLDEAAFRKRALELSANPQMAAVGWVDLASVPPPLSAAVRETPAGTVSAPVESPMGFHLIRVNRVGKDVAPPLDELRERVVGGWRAEHEEAKRQELYLRALGEIDVRWLAPANILRGPADPR